MKPTRTTDKDFDVIVAGAGSVGMAGAVALADLGWRVAIAGIPSGPGSDARSDTAYETRIYALSPGNADWLDELGAWALIDPGRMQAVSGMEIRGDDGTLLELDAYACGVSRLAIILEDGRLQRALEQVARDRCTWLEDTVAEAYWNADRVRVSLDRHGERTASLLVGADGARSAIRAAAGIDVHRKPYGQCGVVANFRCERPHRGIARQWFRPDGILAWLPLPGEHVSIVWSTPNAHADELVNMPAESLADTVAAAGGKVLGRFEAISAPASFPLVLARAESAIGTRLALAGDAAHTVHPLAGQGLNLGLRDVRALARAIGPRTPEGDCGSPATLLRFRRARAEDVLSMELVTDGLKTLFDIDNPLVRLVRNRGLGLTDRMGWVKRALVSAAVR